MASASTEMCLVCKRKTHGAVLCSLKCHSVYSSNKHKYKKRKIIIELEKTRREKAIENLKEANEARRKNAELARATHKDLTYWEHLRSRTSE